MRRLRYGTGGKRVNLKTRCSRAPVAGAATVEHRTSTSEVGRITKPSHRPLIRGGSL
jgi:hypothetical protein